MAPTTTGSSSPFVTSEFVEIASGLGYPEGPVYRSDGSLTVLEVKTGSITRLTPSGTRYSASTA